jgi:hypothetical protein
MGVGPAGAAQIQDDVKRTVALHRDQEIPGARFTVTEIQILDVPPHQESSSPRFPVVECRSFCWHPR